MTLELSISAASANKAQNPHPLRISDDESSIQGLSLAEKETFNLARKAENGDNAWDKAILNLVHPPALMLFALLDTGRKAVAPPLPQVQEAYSDVAKVTQQVPTPTGQDTSKSATSQTGTSDTKSTSAIAVQAVASPAATSASSAPSSTQTIIA